MKYNKLHTKGFSLIELMVSIAIVAILTALIIVNIASSRAKARDAKRISDIAQIQLALEQYFTKNGTYPTLDQYTGPNQLIVPAYLSKLPVDPSGTNYVYAQTQPVRYDYILRATLEKSIGEGLGGSGVQINGYDCDPNSVYYCVSSK